MATTVARLEALLTADTRQFDRGMDSAEKRSHKVSRGIGVGMKIAGAAIAAGLGAAAYGAKKAVDAALEAQRAELRLEAAFKQTGVSAKQKAAAMEVVSATSRKAALDDEDLMDTLGRLTRVTGSVEKAQRDMGIAADIARGRNISLEAATKLVEGAEMGRLGALKRMGIEIPKVTTAQDALEASSKKATDGQKAAAKAADEVATRQSAVAALQKQYAGAAEAYGRSSAAAGEQLSVAWENLQERIGTMVLPILARLAQWFTRELPNIERITERVFGIITRTVSTAFSMIESLWRSVLKPTVDAIVGVFTDMRQKSDAQWGGVQGAAAKVVTWYRTNLEPTIRSVVENISEFWTKHESDIRRIFGLIQRTVERAMNIIKDVVEAVLALIRGDWDRVWSELKSIAGRILGGLADIIKTLGPILARAAMELGKAIIQGIVDGIQAAPGLIKDALVSMVSGAFNAAKDWLGSRSPSKRAADELGKPISEGVAQGLVDNKRKITDALVQTLDDAIAAAEGRAQLAAGRLANTLGFAFSKRQGAAMTPAEKRLAAISERRTQEGLTGAVSEAERRLEEARAGGDAAEILEAQRNLARAREDILIHSLEVQAQKEREGLEQRQMFEQQKFQERLAALQAYLTSGEATQRGANQRIRKLMDDFGLEQADMSKLFGAGWAANFALGIRRQIPAVVDAVNDLMESIRRRKVVGGKAQAELEAFEKATMARVLKSSGASGDLPGGRVVSGPSGGSTLDRLVSFARQLGFNPSANQLTSGDHVRGSLHYIGKAVDMSGSASQMREAFYSAIATFGNQINELFYDPIGWHINDGRKFAGAMGGHADHVHLGLYDTGGVLRPGWTLAYNGTGTNEYVSRGATTVNLYNHGVLGSEREVVGWLKNALARDERRG